MAAGGELDAFDAGRCADGYALGLAVGRRFAEVIRSRMRQDLVLREQLLPFASTAEAQPLSRRAPVRQQGEVPAVLGRAGGHRRRQRGPSPPGHPGQLQEGGPALHPEGPEGGGDRAREEEVEEEEADDDCSDVLIVSDSTAIAAHNEDGNVALLGHTYLVRATLPDGVSFTAYTYAGELPSCAFGFNTNGVAFTLNAVPPVNDEIVAGAIALNFVSRDLLEAKNLEDAMHRVCSPFVSVGHNYNLMDIRGRRIVNVETASGNRFAVREAGALPFFHANMYRHLQVKQDENSMSREKRAAQCPVDSKETALSLLGDTADEKSDIVHFVHCFG
ncbi:unnamed protein product [Miscanthus lutarioriparius]|uniref:Peptidase C45 hydrolase domain-containing protein n=1 Tax=Miscanthus lutarioriparius TaxID=422564 RepID=A0A811PK58_9POAL|nr:unnamed protein product [Miscanthus lutarioriparius]